MRQLIATFSLFTAFFSTSLLGQFFHTDPYQISFTCLYIEHTRQEILDNNIKSISCLEYELKKDGTKKKNSKQTYFVRFNSFGNPVHYHYKYVMPCWWLPTLKQKLKLEKETSEVYDYFFQYDSLQNLIHVHEYIVESHSSSHSENDVYYYYDQKNNLMKQTISYKTIYKQGYKYRGVSYDNDTILVKYTFNYDDENNVTMATRWIKDSERFRNVNTFDTLVLNCSFDNIFALKELPKGVIIDSLGRIVEKAFFSVHGIGIGGVPLEKRERPNDIIQKYFYDNDGRLFKTERHFRSGDFVSRMFWKYDSNGLIISRQYENARSITVFEYERY